ncbi:MAG: hypothetical protein WKG32_20135 [Gemmatimonadaceae bacterium]
MLAYLQLLRAALVARDELSTRRLLKHDLAPLLPPRVREEAMTMIYEDLPTPWFPVRLFRFYELVETLLAEAPARPRDEQLELSLGPMTSACELTVARAGLLSLDGRRPERLVLH